MFTKDAPIVQNVTDNDVVAVLIPYGGHHTDLMYSDPIHDPECVVKARLIERDYVVKWINQWYETQTTNKLF